MGIPPARVARLFPDEVMAEEAVPSREKGDLFPAERDAVARAVNKRRLEYAAARTCARRAMARIGVPPQPLLNGPDRAPIWPDGVVGSISHTRDYCAVVVARGDRFESVGLDVEVDEPVEEALFDRICTARELARIRSLPVAERGRAVRLVFSAKECFYKLQYPLTQQYLGFCDVELEIDANIGHFTATLLRSSGHRFAEGDRLKGNLRRADGLILTGMSLRRPG